MEASSSVKVPAPPPCRLRASSGSSASSAVECRKKIEMRMSTARMRCDWRTNCTPTRMALISRSRPSGLGVCSRRQRRTTKPEATRQHRVEREHPDAAGARDQRAGQQRADDARGVHRDAVERRAPPAAGCAAPARARWPRTPASAAPGRCRWRRSAPAAAARSSGPAPIAAHSTIAVPASQNCVAISQRRRSRMSASAPLGRPEQEHRQGGGRLHQRDPDRRGGQRGHHPGRRHVVHPHADVGDQPGAPQHAEHRQLERLERRRCAAAARASGRRGFPRSRSVASGRYCPRAGFDAGSSPDGPAAARGWP